jgi:hypothetical protein
MSRPRFAPELSAWLEANAFGLDADSALAAEVLTRLAADGVLGLPSPTPVPSDPS